MVLGLDLTGMGVCGLGHGTHRIYNEDCIMPTVGKSQKMVYIKNVSFTTGYNIKTLMVMDPSLCFIMHCFSLCYSYIAVS